MTIAASTAALPDRFHDIEKLDRLARWLDSGFRMPGTGIRFGWDALFGLIPVLGDSLAMLVALYIPFRAWRMGVGYRTLLRMFGNLGVDWLVGQIPLFGDLFDIGFRCNVRNMALLRDRIQGI